MHGIFVHFKRTLYIFVRLCRINVRNMLNFQQTLRLQMLTVKNSPNRILKKCKANASLLFTATARGKRQPSNPLLFYCLPARTRATAALPFLFSPSRAAPPAPLSILHHPPSPNAQRNSRYVKNIPASLPAQDTSVPPHSTTVNPSRRKGANCCGSISCGCASGFHAMNTRSILSGFGVIVSSAACVYRSD